MGCERHPNGNGRRFDCSGDLGVVYAPYFFNKETRTEYPHWNGAPAFGEKDNLVETRILPTAQTRLTAIPGEVEQITVAVVSLRRAS